MRLSRLLILVAILLVVGGGAIYFVTSQQNQTQALTPQQITLTADAGRMITVVYLLQPVNSGEEIRPDQLGVQEVPFNEVKDVMEIYFETVDEVAGKMARMDLTQGQYVSEDMVMDGLDSDSLGSEHAHLIPSGYVAFPVPVNRFSSVAYGLATGDRVDIIVTLAFVDLDTQFQSITPNSTAGVLTPGANLIIQGEANILLSEFYSNLVAQSATAGSAGPQGRAELDALLDQTFYYVPSEPQRPRVVSQMVMQNLAVLNVGNFPVYNQEGQEVTFATATPTVPAGEEGQAPPPGKPVAVPPDIITLVMTPQDAVTLNYLIFTGAKITLALRSAGDDDAADVPTDAVMLQYLIDEYQIPVPNRQPYGLEPRLDVLEYPVLENDAPGPEIIQ